MKAIEDIDTFLQHTALAVAAKGPTRVVVDAQGRAYDPYRARAIGVHPDVVFIRGDGWTLGAPAALEDVARHLWRSEWVGVMRRDGTAWGAPERV